MPIWESVKAGAAKAGKKAADATKLAAQKTKLKADIVLCDREVIGCKKAFGVTMYDHVSPLSQTADFYAANDDLTEILRPPLIIAQKEIQALAAKRVKLKEKLAAAEAKRAAAFPTPAENAGQKVVNFGKASAMMSNETKIKAEISMLDSRIKGFKQDFGLNLFSIMVDAEDSRGYLPSDRQIRNIYDQTRQDVHKIHSKKQQKTEELKALGGNPSSTAENSDQTAAATAAGTQPQQPAVGGYSDTPAGFSGNQTGYSDTVAAPATTTQTTDSTNAFSDNQEPDLLML